MRLVDKSDMQISSIECTRKTVKWYNKLFLHLLDISMLNSYLLYKRATNNKLPLREFSLSVIRQLLQKYGEVKSFHPGRQNLRDSAPDRLEAANYIARHHLANIPPKGNRAVGQRNCHVCTNTSKNTKQRKTVSMWCPECKVPLCTLCFVSYHCCSKF